MSPLELKGILVNKLESIISKYCPGGRYESGRYVCRAISGGGAGKECSIITAGPDAGTWKEFNTGRNGDILKIIYYNHGEDNKIMFQEARRIAGLNNEIPKEIKKTITKPNPNTWRDLTEDSHTYEYLTGHRSIDPKILEAYDVKQTPEDDGYVFLCKLPKKKEVNCLATYVKLKRTPEGKKDVRRSNNGLACLWGIHASEFNPEYIIVTFGQIDAMSYAVEDLQAVSVPGGDSDLAWISSSWDWLAQFKTIYLSYSDDEPEESVRDVIIARLGMERVKIINLPKKDANDCLKAGIPLRPLFDSAKDIKPAKSVSARDLREEVWQRMIKGRIEDQGIPFMGWEDDNSIQFRIRPQELTIYTGFPGGGKSAILYQLAAYLICKEGKKIAMASLEEPLAKSIQLIAFAAMAYVISEDTEKNRELYNHTYDMIQDAIYGYKHIGQAPAQEVLEFGEYHIKRNGCEHFIIDSVAKIKGDFEDNSFATNFVEQIAESMNKTGAHYHMVAHSRKGTRDDITKMPTIDSIKGAAQFGISTFNVLTVWRNVKKDRWLDREPDAVDKHTNRPIRTEWGDAIINVSKQKAGGAEGEYPIWYNPDNYRFRRSYEEIDEPYIDVTQPF